MSIDNATPKQWDDARKDKWAETITHVITFNLLILLSTITLTGVRLMW